MFENNVDLITIYKYMLLMLIMGSSLRRCVFASLDKYKNTLFSVYLKYLQANSSNECS